MELTIKSPTKLTLPTEIFLDNSDNLFIPESRADYDRAYDEECIKGCLICGKSYNNTPKAGTVAGKYSVRKSNLRPIRILSIEVELL